MSELVGSDDQNNEVEIVTPEKKQENIFLDIYREAYKQITGRSEQSKASFSENLLLEFDDINQLHIKIMQLCGIHSIVAKSEVITIFHAKDKKQQFPSFEKFKTYNSSAISPTVTLLLKYNFSIFSPETRCPQEYVVTIRLASKLAVIKQLETEAPAVMRGRLWNYINANTAEITIDYSDYVVARGFFEAFDEWIKGCKKTAKPPGLEFFQRRSHQFPTLIQVFTVGIFTYFSAMEAQKILLLDSSNSRLSTIIIAYIGIGYILSHFAQIAGKILEHAVDSYPILSYLKLNRGDDNLVEEFKTRKSLVIRNLISSSLLSLAIGVLSKYIVKFL